jgi:hypothetical protein
VGVVVGCEEPGGHSPLLGVGVPGGNAPWLGLGEHSY